MKLDKDTVVKQQFWFLLGTFFLVWIIAVFWLKFAAAEPIKKSEDAYKAADTKLKAASKSPKNPDTFCPPWQEYGKVFDKHKQVIWAKAWDLQKDMYDWPAELRSKDMYTPQTELSQDERERYKGQFYPEEVKTLKAFVEGDAKKGFAGLLGPVELAGGFDNIFKPQKLDETPTREECWLTQEDYWVKRELFYVVSNAMASQAYMYPIAIDEKKEPMPKDVLYRHRYRNQNWEITLHIKQNKEKLLVLAGDSTIKNIQPSQHSQTLTSAKGAGIVFNVFQDKASTAFEVRGEPVPWGSEQKFSTEDYKKPLDGIDWSKTKEHAVGLSQAFDWSTCPIRRIEAMAIGQQSCRTYTTPLQPDETLVKLDAPKEDPADANKEKEAPAGGAPGMPGGAGGMMGMGGGMPGGPPAGAPGMGLPGQKGATTGNPTPNNAIERNRYLQAPKKETPEAEKPSRHLPLALQLLVDQSHMPDVLVALANSRLRMQITQVEFHRVRDIKQADADKNGGGMSLLRTGYMPLGMGSGMMPPNMSGMMPPRGGSGMMPPNMSGMRPPRGGSGMMSPRGGSGMMPPGMPPMMGMPGQMSSPKPFMPPSIMTPSGMSPRNPLSGQPPATGDTKDKKASQGDENLVEMTVYGVATLYRRPDPPKPTDAQTAQPGQPATPLPTTPPAPTGPGR